MPRIPAKASPKPAKKAASSGATTRKSGVSSQATLAFPAYPNLESAIRMFQTALPSKPEATQAVVTKWLNQLQKMQTEIAQLEKLEKLTAGMAKLSQNL